MFAPETDTSWCLLVSLTILTIFWLWSKTRRPYTRYNIPPFPVSPWPVFGHLFLMFGNLRDKLKKWRSKAGDIYSIDIAGQHNILVNDYNTLKEIWVKQADRITNCPNHLGDEIMGEYNTGIFSARDDNWKEQRTASLSILRSFGMGKNIMADRIQEEVSVILDKLAAFKGQPEDVRVLFNISVSNVICSVAVGKRFKHEDSYFRKLVYNLNTIIKYFNIILFLTPMKMLYSLPGDVFNAKRWVKASIEVNELFSKAYIKKIKEKYSENEEPDNFVAAYLQEMKKLKDKGIQSNLSEENLVVLIRSLFLAGTETTSTTILWCLLFMLHNPEVQDKVYREIEAQVGTSRLPNLSDKPNLTYFNAVIMETQRMSSLAIVGLRREVSETFEASGYTFPKGSILWNVLDSVMYDKKIWGDPNTFRPERFIDKNGALIIREELIPFGVGRRVCLGEALARMELFLFLSAMFQRFRFEPEDISKGLPTLKEGYSTTSVPQPFKLRFIDRFCEK